MVYVTGTPLAGEAPSVSQPKIQTNFSELNTQFGVEHAGLTTGGGKHKYITLKQSPAIGAIAAPDAVLTQQISGSFAPFLQFNDTTSAFIIPFAFHKFTIAIGNGAGQTVIDLSANGFVNFAGTLHCWHSGTFSKQCFATFVYRGGVVKFGSGSTQLIGSGTDIVGFTSNGAHIIKVNTTAAFNMDLSIVGTPL